MNTLKCRSFLTLLDFKPEEIAYLLDLSKKLKQIKRNNTEHPKLSVKTLF